VVAINGTVVAVAGLGGFHRRASSASPLSGGLGACAGREFTIVASSSRRVASVVGVKKPAMLASIAGVDPPGPGLAIRVRFAHSHAFSLGKRVVVRAEVRAPAASVLLDLVVDGGLWEDVVANLQDGTSTGRRASATALRARAEARPVTDDAVFRA